MRRWTAAIALPLSPFRSTFRACLQPTGTAQVQTVFDATDVNTTNIATGYAQGIVGMVTADFEQQWAAAHGLRPQTVGVVDLEPRVWFNEGLDSRNFIIPGVVAIILALVGAQLTSLTVAREWERGTMEQLISTPVTAFEFMLGKLVPYFMIGLFDAAFCLCAAAFWFEVPFRGGLCTAHPDDGFVHAGGTGHRLSGLGAHPQPAWRQSGRADADHAAHDVAVGLHVPDRSDAAGDAGGHLGRLCAVLRHHLARGVPEGQHAGRSDRSGPGAGGVCGGRSCWAAARSFHKRLD